MSDSPDAEPSMDEILASIRRIISEDDRSAPIPPAATRWEDSHDEEVLVLRNRLPPAAPEPNGEGIDAAAAARAAQAFDRLAAARKEQTPPTPPVAMPPPGRSLEDVAKELLQPMLKAWLDENLPAIVQERVDEEIERIARRRVR